MSPSPPAVKIQGWRGWNATENTPIPPWGSWLFRTFNGTISGLRARSLHIHTYMHTLNATKLNVEEIIILHAWTHPNLYTMEWKI